MALDGEMGQKGVLDCKRLAVIVAALGSAAQHSALPGVTAQAEAAERGPFRRVLSRPEPPIGRMLVCFP
jgi:hypothetical protein